MLSLGIALFIWLIIYLIMRLDWKWFLWNPKPSRYRDMHQELRAGNNQTDTGNYGDHEPGKENR